MRLVVLNKLDNVGTAVADIRAGEKVEYEADAVAHEVIAADAIPFGFKIALADIAKGGGVVKYGEVIGSASRPIRGGELVHVQNLDGGRGRGDLPRNEEPRP